MEPVNERRNNFLQRRRKIEIVRSGKLVKKISFDNAIGCEKKASGS